MGNKDWIVHLAALMLLLISWKETAHCSGFTVNPPQDLAVSDPGHLGRLVITWRPPASMSATAKCSVKYQLEYFDAHSNAWSALRTKRTMHRANFDLMKDVRVRVYTLLEGPCTKNTVIKSTNYTEVIHKPSNKGVPYTQVEDFTCVFYNMQYTECTWKRSPQTPDNSQQHLYFWHKGLDEAVECPQYITQRGIKSGCNFTERPLPTFTHINFCVNGSSPEGPLEEMFVSLQMQNHVKPAPAEKIYVQTGLDMQLELSWKPPVGPGSHCLEWKVEHRLKEFDGTVSKNQTLTRQTILSLPPVRLHERHCFRVRSKVHKYCADKSFWSDWSQQACHPAVATVGYPGGATEGPSPALDP